MAEVEVPCNYCGCERAAAIFGPGVAQRLQIVRCHECGLMYASPRPADPEHVMIERSAGNEPNQDDILNILHRTEKERLQVRDFLPTRNKINALHPRRGKLLEIGSGFGYLLAQLSADGWSVQGIDPDEYACAYARKTHGVNASAGILETARLPDATFDVVVMNHVIEHLPDPLGTLKEIYRILEPDGHFVLETPRYDTLSFRILGRRERSLSCEGHVYFFTTSSLRQLYEAAGFQLVELRYVGRSLTLDRLFYNVGVMSKSKAFQKSLGRITRALLLNRISIYLNLRDMQRVCVRKR